MNRTRLASSWRIALLAAAVALNAGCSKRISVSGDLELTPYHQATFRPSGVVYTMRLHNHGPGDLHALVVHHSSKPMTSVILHPRSSFSTNWEMVGQIVVANTSTRATEMSYKVRGRMGAGVTVDMSLSQEPELPVVTPPGTPATPLLAPPPRPEISPPPPPPPGEPIEPDPPG